MSNAASDPPPDPAAQAWLPVCDDLLWGFSHALSNRLAAISSITKILEYSDTGLDPLLSALGEEISTLDRTLGLLRHIPRNPDGMSEPVRLEDLLPEILEVHRLRGEVRDLELMVSVEEGVLPVWAEPARLGHALLLLLGIVSRAAVASGAASVVITLQGDEVWTVVRVETAGEEGDRELGDPERRALEALLEESGGEATRVGRAGGGLAFELRLPTLVAVRSRESGSATSS